jgi:hypothetical protein
MTITVPTVASIVAFNPGVLGSGPLNAGTPTGAALAPSPPPGSVPVVNLAAAGTGTYVGAQGGPVLPGGGAIVLAVVMGAAGTGGLIAKLLVHLADGTQAIINNVPHVSTVPAGPCWQWPLQTLFPGSNS